MSAHGTKPKCRNVRFCAAVGWIADITQTSTDDRFRPKADIRLKEGNGENARISRSPHRREDIDPDKVKAITEALAAKRSLRRIARELGVGVCTVYRIRATEG